VTMLSMAPRPPITSGIGTGMMCSRWTCSRSQQDWVMSSGGSALCRTSQSTQAARSSHPTHLIALFPQVGDHPFQDVVGALQRTAGCGFELHDAAATSGEPPGCGCGRVAPCGWPAPPPSLIAVAMRCKCFTGPGGADEGWRRDQKLLAFGRGCPHAHRCCRLPAAARGEPSLGWRRAGRAIGVAGLQLQALQLQALQLVV
jgi:hypothetical protein